MKLAIFMCPSGTSDLNLVNCRALCTGMSDIIWTDMCIECLQMRLTWTSGDSAPQQVIYNGSNATSTVSTFTPAQMCCKCSNSSFLISTISCLLWRHSSDSTCWTVNRAAQEANPAMDFGWHDPGYIHTAVMTGLTPSTSYSYYFGRYLWNPWIIRLTSPLESAAPKLSWVLTNKSWVDV